MSDRLGVCVVTGFDGFSRSGSKRLYADAYVYSSPFAIVLHRITIRGRYGREAEQPAIEGELRGEVTRLAQDWIDAR